MRAMAPLPPRGSARTTTSCAGGARGARAGGVHRPRDRIGVEAVASFGADPPDVLVLDVGLPDADGRDVCQALRARGVRSPVLFLTARDAVTDRLSGFHAGGDDYLTKPFALAELVVRVQALLRRRGVRADASTAGWCWTRRPRRHRGGREACR